MSHNRDRTHCRRGHLFSASNTRLVTKKDGRSYRECITCCRARVRASYKRQTSTVAGRRKAIDRSNRYRRTKKGRQAYERGLERRRMRYHSDEVFRAYLRSYAKRCYDSGAGKLRSKQRNNDLVEPVVVQLLTRHWGGSALKEQIRRTPNNDIIALYRAYLKLKRLIRCQPRND